MLDDLLAVGFSNGRVDLLRFEASKHAHNSAAVSLPARNTRACNAVAFSPANPNYLAVGLDKVRNDPSLVIWDINSTLPALSLHATSQYDSPSRPLPHLPRGEAPRTGADTRVLQQHASAEVVSTLAWLPNNSQLLLAGISHRWLQLYDLRSPSSSPAKAASKVHGIATDPFDAHRVACYSEGIVSVWDIRRFTQPVLTFTAKDASADGADGVVVAHPGARGKATPTASTAVVPLARGTLATEPAERGAGWLGYQRSAKGDAPDASSTSGCSRAYRESGSGARSGGVIGWRLHGCSRAYREKGSGACSAGCIGWRFASPVYCMCM